MPAFGRCSPPSPRNYPELALPEEKAPAYEIVQSIAWHFEEIRVIAERCLTKDDKTARGHLNMLMARVHLDEDSIASDEVPLTSLDEIGAAVENISRLKRNAYRSGKVSEILGDAVFTALQHTGASPDDMHAPFASHISTAIDYSRAIEPLSQTASDALDAVITFQLGKRTEFLMTSLSYSARGWRAVAEEKQIAKKARETIELATTDDQVRDLANLQSAGLFRAIRRNAMISLPNKSGVPLREIEVELSDVYKLTTLSPESEHRKVMAMALSTMAEWASMNDVPAVIERLNTRKCGKSTRRPGRTALIGSRVTKHASIGPMFKPSPREYPTFEVPQDASPYFLPTLPVARHLRERSDAAVEYLNQDGANAAYALDDDTLTPGVSNAASRADVFLRSEFRAIIEKKSRFGQNGYYLEAPLREVVELINRNYNNPAYDPEFKSFNATATPDITLVKAHEVENAFEIISNWPYKHADLTKAARTVLIGATLYAARQLAEQLAEPEAPFRESELPKSLQKDFDVRIKSALALSEVLRKHHPGAADALNAIIDMQIGNRVEALGSSMGSRTHWSKTHRSDIVKHLLSSAQLATNEATQYDIATMQTRAAFVAARRLADSSLPATGRAQDKARLTQLGEAYSALVYAPVPELQELMRRALDTYALWHTKTRHDQVNHVGISSSELKSSVNEVKQVVGEDTARCIDDVITGVAEGPSVDTLVQPIEAQLAQRATSYNAPGL